MRLLRRLLLLCLLLAPVALNATSPDPPPLSCHETEVFLVDTDRMQLHSHVTVEIINDTDSKRKMGIYRIWDPWLFDIHEIGNAKLFGPHFKVMTRNVPSRIAFINDLKVHLVTSSKRIKPGRSLELKYEKRYRSLDLIPIITFHDQEQTEVYTLDFRHREDERIEFELVFDGDSIATEIKRPDARQSILQLGPFPDGEEKPCLPWSDLAAQLLVKIYRNDTLLTRNTPAAIAGWYRERDSLPPVLDSPPPALAEAVDPLMTDWEILEAINSFITREIRYLSETDGEHCWLPREPATVLARGYGDCKDKAFLFAALAGCFDLTVRPALVSDEPYIPFPEQLVHFGFFDHMFGFWTDGRDSLAFDPTAGHFPLGALPAALEGKRTLVLDPEHPFWFTTAPPSTESNLQIAVQAAVDRLQVAPASIRLRDDLRVEALTRFDLTTDRSQSQILIDIIEPSLYRIELVEVALDSADTEVLYCSAVADLSQLILVSSERVYIPKVALQVQDNRLADRRADAKPIYLDSRDRIELGIDLDLGGRYYAANGDDLRLGDPASDLCFSSEITVVDSARVLFHNHYRRNRMLFEGDRKRELIDFDDGLARQRQALFQFDGVE